MACFEQAKYTDKYMLHSYSVTRSYRQALLQTQSTKKDQFATNSRVKTYNLDI